MYFYRNYEKDSHTFFTLFEHIAEIIGWPDSHKTLILQCVFTGRARRAFSALISAESSDYEKFKVAVLKAYELIPEAYRHKFWSQRKGGKNAVILNMHMIFWLISHIGALPPV